MSEACVIKGKWRCCENGTWKFSAEQGVLGRCVSVEGKKYSDLEKEIGNLFGVNRKSSSIGLTFWYPGETMVFTQEKKPPVTISGDGELAKYKEKRVEYGGLDIYLTVTDLCNIVHKDINDVNEKISTVQKDIDDVHDKISYVHGDVRMIDEVWLDDETLVACVERAEAVYEARLGKAVDSSTPVNVRKRRYLEDNFGGTAKRTSLGERCSRGQSSIVDNCSTIASNNNVHANGLREDNFPVQVSDDVYIDGSIDNNSECDKGKVDNSDFDSEQEYTQEDSIEYDFDEWSERINNEYPLDWDPYKLPAGNGNGLMALIAEVENRVPDFGEKSDLGAAEEENMLPIGLDAIGELIRDESHVTTDVVVAETSHVSRQDEEDFMSSGCHVIDSDDPLLLNDAPPCHDNLRAGPSQERNMDLKRGDDAIYVGKIFANKAEFRSFLSVYAMKRVFTFKIPTSDKGRVIANCIDPNCGWRVYATSHPSSDNLEVRTCTLKHNCVVSSRSRYGEKATATVLADLIKSKYGNGKKGPRACELPALVLAELNVTISYMKAWNAREIAINASLGSEEGSYRFLPTYLHLVTLTNPGTITNMHTTYNEKGKTLFKYLFFAFGASINGYKYLRKVIVIDGTALKGKYKGCLVAASGQDGNMQIYPLGFGIVDGENHGGWVWFFRNLAKFVPDEEDLVFVSDRHTAIYSGLREVYPKAHHACCAVHLFRNVKHKFQCEGLAGVVSKAARAFTVGDFRYHFKEVTKRDPKCAKWLLDIGLEHWTLSHFPGNRYNLMSSNISESLNAALQKAVDYPIVSLVEFLRAMLMRWFWCRRTVARKTKTRCTPEIEDLLIEHLKDSTDCAVLPCSDWIYQVTDGIGRVFTTNLEEKTCTCRVFEVLKVPCCHAMAARRLRNLDEYTMVDETYFIGPWQLQYEMVVMPVPNEKDSVIPDVVADLDVNPPKTKRPGGRPRKVRIPSQGEKHHAKKAGPRKCGRCNGVGHNRKTCSTVI